MKANEEDRARALAMYAEGCTIAQIATELKRGNSLIWSWMKAAGTLRPSAKELHHDQALADYLKGDHLAVIADRYGASEATVRAWVRAAGLQGKGGKKASIANYAQQAVDLYLDGKRYSEIARTLKVSASAVARWIAAADIPDGEGGSAHAAKLDAEEAVKLYGNGATVEIISRHLGRGEKTVSQWLGEAGVHVQSAMERRTPEQQRAYSLLAAAKAKEAVNREPDRRICAHCGGEYELPYTQKASPQKYCSKECFGLAKTDPDKKLTAICQTCTTPFETYRARPAKFCCRNCADQGRRAIQWEFDGNVLDSSWEALFVGLAAMNGLPCTRFDRTGVVTWNDAGSVYGPDFTIEPRSQQIAVEIKGAQDASDLLKWAAYRRTGALLAVVNGSQLGELKALTPPAFADRLLALALTQGEQDS